MKKIWQVSVSVILLLIYFSTFINVFAYNTITEEEINAYLEEQGMMEIVVQKMPFDLKKQIYLGKVEVDIGEPTYGILTDNYKVEYKLDNGNVVIDSQNREELHRLMSDEKELASVMLSKEEANAKQVKKVLSTAVTEKEMVAERKAEINAYLEENIDEVHEVQKMSEEIALLSLKNWQSTMTCVHLSYENSMAEKWLWYAWEWSYSPFNTLTDKAGMAWSGEFLAEPETFFWIYQGHTSSTEDEYFEWSGIQYTDYNLKNGIGTAIDIKTSYNLTGIVKHVGLLSVFISKYTNTESYEAAVGSYFHKYVGVNANGSLSFDPNGAAPSISISLYWNYDKAPDAADTFFVKKGD